MARCLAEMKLRIEIARTFEEDQDESPETKRHVWLGVQRQYIELTRTVAEAKLYGAAGVVKVMEQLLTWFDEISEKTDGFDVAALPNYIGELNNLVIRLDNALTAHARAFRQELDYDRLEDGSASLHNPAAPADHKASLPGR
jgi:hypothetical protein